MEWPFKKVRRKVSLFALTVDDCCVCVTRLLASPSLSNLMGEEVVSVLERVLKILASNVRENQWESFPGRKQPTGHV